MALPADLAILLVGVAARQATSPTAQIQQGQHPGVAQPTPMAPTGGSFNAAAAATIAEWKGE